MKYVIKKALISTLPVLTGYLVLGFGFGLIMKSAGIGVIPSLAMSLLIYAGSMQYAAVGLLSGGASLITVAVTALMVNARHLFYGVSMLDKYRGTGAAKTYLALSLTDETFSLLCRENPEIAEENKKSYYITVSVLNHFYWVAGTLLGSLAGALLMINTEGVDFALTALFVTVFVEGWLTSKKHIPALIGLFGSALSLIIFGSGNFLIPSMLLIALSLCLYKEGEGNE